MANPLYPAVGFSHFHSLDPDADLPLADKVGPRALAFQIAGVSSTNPVTFDLVREVELEQTRNIQAVFIDNSGNANDLTLTNLEIPGMTVIARANKQAILPFFGSSFGNIKATTSNAAPQNINVLFLNTPQPYATW
jgi:hypothetical protein